MEGFFLMFFSQQLQNNFGFITLLSSHHQTNMKSISVQKCSFLVRIFLLLSKSQFLNMNSESTYKVRHQVSLKRLGLTHNVFLYVSINFLQNFRNAPSNVLILWLNTLLFPKSSIVILHLEGHETL